MASIETILGADNGAPVADKLSQAYPKINRNFAELNAELTAEEAARLAADTEHATSTAAHAAEHITYSGEVMAADNVAEAIDTLKEVVDAAIVNGDSSPQASAAAVSVSGTTYPTLKGRLDAEYSGTVAQLADIATVYARNHGVKADGATDDTSALLNAIADAVSKLPCTIRLPKGTICYTDLGNLAYEGLTIEGAGEKATILKCTSSVVNHSAILMNAFRADTPSDQFVKKCNLRNLQVQGNANTDSVINLQGIVHSHWVNIIANSANNTTGKAYNFRGVMTSLFESVSTSAALGTQSPVPYTGIYITDGLRGGVSCGSSTNNTFVNCYFETVTNGIHLHLADHNTFISGAAESNADKGTYIEQSSCRWNTFIGVAHETNTNYDVYDKGRSTQFINIYTAKLVRLEGQQSRLSGGFHGKIEVPGQSNIVENVRVNRNGTDVGGFSDTGIGNFWRSINDAFLAAYVYPLKTRAGITVGASPFTWQNTTGNYVEVIAATGTLSGVQGNRAGASSWTLATTTPGKWLVAPGDSITITYSVAPGLSYLTLNGF